MNIKSAPSNQRPTTESLRYLRCTATGRHRTAQNPPQPAVPGRHGPPPAMCTAATRAADLMVTQTASRLLAEHILGPHREHLPALCSQLASRQLDQPTMQSLTRTAKLNIDLGTMGMPRSHLRQLLDAFGVQIQHDCRTGTVRVHAEISSMLHQPAPSARTLPTITAIEIAQIDHTPMTPEEYHTAVEALAVLIRRWWHTTPT